MERNEFLAALRERLTGLPAEEVQSALRYYEEYLDEAGRHVRRRSGRQQGP